MNFLNRKWASCGVLLSCLVQSAFAEEAVDCQSVTRVENKVAYINATPSAGIKDLSLALQCAEQAAFRYKGIAEVQITLGKHKYRQEEPATISTVLQRPGLKVRIRGQGSNTIISGAQKLSNWGPLKPSGAVERQLPNGTWKGQILEVNIPPDLATAIRVGLSRDHGRDPLMAPPELIVDGKILKLARWPNEDYLSVFHQNSRTRRLRSMVELTPRLNNHESVFAHGFWMYDWADSQKKAEVLVRDDVLDVALFGPWPKYGVRKGGKYYLSGSPAFLDIPGEYVVLPDRDAIAFIPPASSPKIVELTDTETSIDASSISSLILENFVIQGFRSSGVNLKGDNIYLRDCEIKNIGVHGVRLAGSKSLIEGCHVHHTGAVGIKIKGGERETLVPGRIRVNKTLVNDFGRLYWTSTPGIRVDGVGNIVTNSVIKNGPHSGIFYFGNDHFIADNEISQVARLTGDVGAIYTGKDWAGRGNRIYRNYIHDVHGVGIHGATGIYIDDQSSGVEARGNIIWNVDRGVLIGGGRDNIIERNIFVKTKECLRLDNRGLNTQRHLVRPGGEIWASLHEVPYDGSIYKAKYPELADVLQDRPGVPVGNFIAQNVGPDCVWRTVPEASGPETFGRNWMKANGMPDFAQPDLVQSNSAPPRSAFALDWSKIIGALK
ncbi:MAG: right-handed parallel beta-helix repeat-containing protein [Pseudomonadota bacterium]